VVSGHGSQECRRARGAAGVARRGGRALVVGGGYIGLEAAAVAAKLAMGEAEEEKKG